MPKINTCIFLFSTFLAGSIFLSGCENSIRKYYEELYPESLYQHSSYNMASPDKVIPLPAPLREISGLSLLDDSRLIAVQDERGVMYVISQTTGEIEAEIKFGKKGDYEGIALTGEKVYVIKSSGTIYRFALDINQQEVESTEIKTSLTSANDVEGLTYDKSMHRLLIACKGQGELSMNEAKGKSVYSFDLSTLQLNEEPVYSIRKKDIAEIIEGNYPDIKLKDKIGPSGIAIHPKTGNTYVLAHVGKTLIELNQDGTILKYYPLNPSLFRQPEGICFNAQGDLFISNEASGKRPTLMKFSYRPQ